MVHVELDGVHRTYGTGAGQVAALTGLTLSIEGPRFVSVLGPSGAGKSTLLHLIGGLDTATAGTVRVDGVDLSSLDDDSLAEYRRHRTGFVFQTFNLLGRLTAEENVAVPCLLDRVRPAEAYRQARQALALVGLGGLERRRPTELSGGQLQRVAIARALVLGPPLLLADEPTGNLDSGTGEEIVELLRSLTRQGRTVIMATHNERAGQYSDRVIRLADGRVTADRARADAQTPLEPADLR